MTNCCDTCTAEMDHNDLYLVQAWVRLKNGLHTAAEIDICPRCLHDVECEVLVDPEGNMYDRGARVRENA